MLSPSAVSEGESRLYTDKDVIKLHQILSLKHLGFSLDDIRDRLITLRPVKEDPHPVILRTDVDVAQNYEWSWRYSHEQLGTAYA